MSDLAALVSANVNFAPTHVPYGASLGNVDAFQLAMTKAEHGNTIQPKESSALRAVTTTLERLNLDAKMIAEKASAAEAKGASMTPGEMVMMTVRCHEFMFHCQLTSNVANRTSDGIQQLFRQQS